MIQQKKDYESENSVLRDNVIWGTAKDMSLIVARDV